MSMFCYQCEQTAGGTGCTKQGVCGKNSDIASLQDTLIFGLKGIAAYAFHARVLGYTDPEIDAFMSKALFSTLTNVNFDMKSHLDLVLEAGKVNLKAMQILDAANNETFGVAEPTKVNTGTCSGPGILVTGHDLLDLRSLLEQTEGTGINIYTHGEMLPAHGYPKLKRFKHLAGTWGGAWQKQRQEFADFPGAILATTNCVLIPPKSYNDRIFTTGIARLPEVPHVHRDDFSAVIDKARSLPALEETSGKTVTTGFNYRSVLKLAGPILEAIKAKKIRHFFMVGGCDGTRTSRSYYTEFVRRLPQDTVILTLGCGKFRLTELELGDIDGIPRLLDLGQCNDAYSALQIALALADALDCEVNDLPLTLVVSWFEQKAVAILLTLLHLGIKGIRLGPSLPAFLTPPVLQVLMENFDLQPVTTPAEDIAAILG